VNWFGDPPSGLSSSIPSGGARIVIRCQTRDCWLRMADIPRRKRLCASIKVATAAVVVGMALHAQRNQVLFAIISAMAAKFLMVNFKIRLGPANLTSPAVTP